MLMLQQSPEFWKPYTHAWKYIKSTANTVWMQDPWPSVHGCFDTITGEAHQLYATQTQRPMIDRILKSNRDTAFIATFDPKNKITTWWVFFSSTFEHIHQTSNQTKDLDYRLVLKCLKSADVNQNLPPGVTPLYKAALAGEDGVQWSGWWNEMTPKMTPKMTKGCNLAGQTISARLLCKAGADKVGWSLHFEIHIFSSSIKVHASGNEKQIILNTSHTVDCTKRIS